MVPRRLGLVVQGVSMILPVVLVIVITTIILIHDALEKGFR